MKANELRIGNYVYFNNEDIHQINGYDIHDIDTDPLEDSFTPIPLTEDWLLKFGLSEMHYQEYILTDNYWGVYFYYDDVNGNWTVNTNHEYKLTEIKYVHQLQNLYFALTGEELKIKEDE